MLTRDDAFWKGAQEVFNRHKMAFWGGLARAGIGAGIGAAGGLMMRDEGESAATTMGRMAFGAGVGGLAGGYGPRMLQRFRGAPAPKPNYSQSITRSSLAPPAPEMKLNWGTAAERAARNAPSAPVSGGFRLDGSPAPARTVNFNIPKPQTQWNLRTPNV